MGPLPRRAAPSAEAHGGRDAPSAEARDGRPLSDKA